jgi:hypothetical protein
MLCGAIYHWYRYDQNCDRLGVRVRAERRRCIRGPGKAVHPCTVYSCLTYQSSLDYSRFYW